MGDLAVVAILLLVTGLYGTFLMMYSSDAIGVQNEIENVNSSQYDTPEAGNFFDQLNEMKDTSISTPEILFMNSIVFGTLAFLLVFVGLRFLRGVG